VSDPYVYPDCAVLRNKLNLRDETVLEVVERQFATSRMRDGCPSGTFDLSHLQKIHHYLFQDIYDWAGKVRTVEISKGGSTFQGCEFIATGMADVHRRLGKAKFLRGLTPANFASQAGQIMGDVNYVHPFREGNGRTQLQYLKQLATQAGHKIDLVELTRKPERWIEASKASHMADYSKMAEAIHDAIKSRRGIETDRSR